MLPSELSSMETSIVSPSPVAARRTKDAAMAKAAVMAAVVSQTTSPAFIGAVSASPVRLMRPQ